MRFNDIVRFVKKESDFAKDPESSPAVLKRERKNNAIERTDKRSIEKGYNKSTKVSSFTTRTSQDMQSQEQVTFVFNNIFVLYVRNFIAYWNVLNSKGKL